MNRKKIITIISITILIIVIATVLIISKNNLTTKTAISETNMSDNEINEQIETLEEKTEEEISNEKEKITPSPTKATSSSKYYIKVNNQMNTVTIYTKDANGQYTVPVKAMVCSTGYASPKNSKYQTLGKWNWGRMIGGVFTQYETHIVDQILFHSVPYLKQYDNSSLEYWEYDKLGTTASAGCVRLTVADAQWIYYNCPVGTWVEFYSSSNPGPLGKPSAMKISGNTEFRGWDPTDPNPNNPWKNTNISTPSPVPTIEPTEIPIVVPTIEPSEIPTVEPSIESTETSTTLPSVLPSKETIETEDLPVDKNFK